MKKTQSLAAIELSEKERERNKILGKVNPDVMIYMSVNPIEWLSHCLDGNIYHNQDHKSVMTTQVKR